MAATKPVKVFLQLIGLALILGGGCVACGTAATGFPVMSLLVVVVGLVLMWTGH